MGNYENRKCLRISTILDPRFKEKGFSSKELAEDAFNEVKSALEKECTDDTGVTDQHEPAPPVAKKSYSLWKDFDEEEAETADSQKNVTGPVSAIEVEMNLYRETARVNRFEDPMKWWRQHSNVMPKLARLAKRHIGIPATSVPSERVFSKAGKLVSARRSRLKKT